MGSADNNVWFYRNSGTGITAEGDMLAALGLTYGTPEATYFSTEVHKTIAVEAYRSSVAMAKERGAFEVYDAQREKDNPFVNRIKQVDPQLYEDMVKYGRRNIACLTIAPTGTTSLMTQTTSGIEPVFMPVYKRRRKVNPNDPNVHVDFTDETGDSFEEYIVYHPKFLTWMRLNGIDTEKRYTQEEIDAIVQRSPYFKATANDVDWMEKVKMQGAIQKWVDHSISVTINLPNDVSEELVGQLYVEAWKCGCKGCTVYRDGSRSGVLISTKSESKKKNEDNECNCPPPVVTEVRPKSLECDVMRFQNNKEKWVAFVGLLEISTRTATNDTISSSRTAEAIRPRLRDCPSDSTKSIGTMPNLSVEYFAIACHLPMSSNWFLHFSSRAKASTHGRMVWSEHSRNMCRTGPKQQDRNVLTADKRLWFIKKDVSFVPTAVTHVVANAWRKT